MFTSEVGMKNVYVWLGLGTVAPVARLELTLLSADKLY